MKKIKNWLPMVLIILATMFLTGCTVDWSTVSATETNVFAVGAFWTLVHIIIPVILFIGFMVLVVPDSFSLEEGSEVSQWILGFALIGIYVFHFWHMKAPWFNLSCLTQLGLLALSFVIFNMVLYDDTDFESIIYAFLSIGIVIVSLLANVYTGKFLEPFVFSCAGYLSIILGSVGRKLRGDGEGGAEILSPILCFAYMIFGVVHADVPNYLYLVAINSSIATCFAHLLIIKTKSAPAYIVLILSYVWGFVSAVFYNPESFGNSFIFALIGWGVLFVIVCVLAYSVQKKNIELAAYKAKLDAERAEKAKAKAKAKAEAEAKAKAEAEKAEAEAKAKAEAEAKAKAEAEAKAKAEAEAKAKAEAEARAIAEKEAKAKQLEETKAALSQLESDLEAKKAEIATLGMDAQSIVKKAQLNKEVKELVPQIETLKAEVERLRN